MLKVSKYGGFTGPYFSVFPSEMIQLSDQVRIILVSQLTKGISGFPSKLSKYFHGTAASAFIILLLLALFQNLDLTLNH